LWILDDTWSSLVLLQYFSNVVDICKYWHTNCVKKIVKPYGPAKDITWKKSYLTRMDDTSSLVLLHYFFIVVDVCKYWHTNWEKKKIVKPYGPTKDISWKKSYLTRILSYFKSLQLLNNYIREFMYLTSI
jgi:isocitrate dehydrogenase